MLNPNSLKAKPADNYDDLKKQFFALKNICESKIKQCSIYSKKLAEYDRESLIARNEALESEKEMNAQLTEELEKANERVKELENAILDSCSTYHFEPDLSQPVSSLNELLIINSKWTLDPEISSDAARFAVENKIDLLCVMVSSASSYLFYHDKLDIRANHLDMLLKNFCNYHREKLRKEQDNE